MVSSKNECVFIRDLSHHTLQIIFDAGCATSKTTGCKHFITSNDCRHGPSWWFYLRCGIEETGIPSIICILCHPVVRHPSGQGTSTMGKHMLAKVHITKLNEWTESEVTELSSSPLHETAVAILKRQASQGITMVSSQRKFILDIHDWSIFTELTHTMLQTGSKGLWNFWMSPRQMPSLPYVRIWFCSYCMQHYPKSRAIMVIYHMKKWHSAAIRHHC